MFDRPVDLSDKQLIAALAEHWRVDMVELDYLPVGFGSHHWRGRDAGGVAHFVTVDEIAAKHVFAEMGPHAALEALRSALGAARAVADGGFPAVAPVRSIHGEVVEALGSAHAVALYPFVDAPAVGDESYESAADRLAVVDLLVRLHAVELPQCVAHEDFALPNRSHLDDAFAALDTAWQSGPFAAPARDLLARCEDHVRSEVARYDRLVASATSRPVEHVLTHGEPHPGNVLRTDQGFALIDWDTALAAPAERDLWVVDEGTGEAVAAYESSTGRTADPDMLELYRLRYDLFEIGGYLALFRGPHGSSADAEESWRNLRWFVTPLAERGQGPAAH